jgi:hypothetical protein
LDTVVSERRLVAVRTTQLARPYFPTNYAPSYGGDGSSPLQRALKEQLAYEATPQAALQMIDYLQQLQTELNVELKALKPKEQKAAQGPVDALRPRLEALPRVDARAQRPQSVASKTAVAAAPEAPVAATQVRSAVAVPQQLPKPQDSNTIEQTVLQNQEVLRQQMMQTQQKINSLVQSVPVDPFALQKMVSQQFSQTIQLLTQKQ